MSRYINKIEVKDPFVLTDKIAAFLQGKGFVLGQRFGEAAWTRRGVNCTQYIIINFEPAAVVITAFIAYFDMLIGEIEAGIKGFIACFGKIPLKKVVRELEKMLHET